MKTMILASSGRFITNNNIDAYLPKKITELKIAYITTASKKVFDKSYIENHKNAMNRLGFNYDEIDISGNNEKKLEQLLKQYEAIIVEGGNTYYLLDQVRKTGFKNIIKKLMNAGVVYIGSSAGSYITTPSIITADWNNKGFDRCNITDYKGMNLVPFIIKAHSHTENISEYKDKSKNLDSPIRFLTDEQAILVKDEQYELIGNGKEFKI